MLKNLLKASEPKNIAEKKSGNIQQGSDSEEKVDFISFE
jgi:hypothetical protein